MTFKPFQFFLFITTILFFSSCQKEEYLNNKVPIADAGASQDLQLKDDYVSTTLKGKGRDTDGRIVAFLWSQVSGPSNAWIVNEGADSTEVNRLKVGKYLFQLMVIDNDGATGVDTVSVTVTGVTAATLNLQPNKNPNEVHIYGNTTLNGSAPGQPEIGAVSWTDGSVIGMRGAFKFDLSSVPSGATITSAYLTLYSNPTPLNGHPSNELRANYGNNNTMLIQRITEDWVANSVTWLNQPASTNTGEVTIPHTDQPFLDLEDIDVTDLVKEMSGSNPNYGFIIKLKTEQIYNSRVFCSSFYSDTTKHPKLVVNYSF